MNRCSALRTHPVGIPPVGMEAKGARYVWSVTNRVELSQRWTHRACLGVPSYKLSSAAHASRSPSSHRSTPPVNGTVVIVIVDTALLLTDDTQVGHRKASPS